MEAPTIATGAKVDEEEGGKDSAALATAVPYDWSSPHALSFSSLNPNLLEVSEEGRKVTARHEMVCCAALGSVVFGGVGCHSWSVTIDLSRLNYGGALCLGCADADAPFTLESGGPAWGFNPYTGSQMSTADAYKVDYSSPGKSLMMGDLQGKSTGAVVTMIVEMGEAPRRIYFSINGSPEVMADVELPERVRPWVHLFKQHDSLTISSKRAAPARRPQAERIAGDDDAAAGAAGKDGSGLTPQMNSLSTKAAPSAVGGKETAAPNGPPRSSASIDSLASASSISPSASIASALPAAAAAAVAAAADAAADAADGNQPAASAARAPSPKSAAEDAGS